MQLHNLHSWDLEPKEAVKCQNLLSKKILFTPTFKRIAIIAGVDASYRNGFVIGGITILKYPELTILSQEYAIKEIHFPYISGLLTFREGPVLVDLLSKIKLNPDIILFDGQGIAHPRKMGIATHMGLFLDMPTIGCAKSRLVGKYTEPGTRKGCYSLLFHKGEIIGAVVRTRDKTKPLFISPGNHMNLEKAIEITLSCTPKYRIPEPIRQTHLFVNKIKNEIFGLK